MFHVTNKTNETQSKTNKTKKNLLNVTNSMVHIKKTLKKINDLKEMYAAAAAKSLQSCPTLCPTAPLSLGFSRQEHWSGCHRLLQRTKVKSEREVAQSCPTLRDPLDCSPPGSSVHGISQVRVLEWAPSPSPRKRMKCIKLYMKCYDIAEVDCDKLNTLPINLKTINKPHTKEP